MTNEFKLTNCILAIAVMLVFCTYLSLTQSLKNDSILKQNLEIKTVAAFNA